MTRTRLLGILLVVATAALTGTASAASVTPTVVGGNPTCADLSPNLIAVSSENTPKDNTYTDGTVHVTVSNVSNGAYSFDWSSDVGIDAVIVKGGPEANVYLYDPTGDGAESTGDTGLVAPANDSTQADGDTYQLSHVVFCYDNDGSPPNDGGGGTQVVPGGAQPSNPTPPGEQNVLGVRVRPGTARLLGPTGCAGRSFHARVVGNGIKSVRFHLDGRRVRAQRHSVRIDTRHLSTGVHRLVATVRFRAGNVRRLRLTFQRCARHFVAPRFTG